MSILQPASNRIAPHKFVVIINRDCMARSTEHERRGIMSSVLNQCHHGRFGDWCGEESIPRRKWFLMRPLRETSLKYHNALI